MGRWSSLLFVGLLARVAIAGDGNKDPTEREVVLPIKLQEPGGYPNNPSSLATPLRQDRPSLVLKRRVDGLYDLRFGVASDSPSLTAVDMQSMIPRIPALAKGDATLTRVALSQREFNRNETRFGPASQTDDLRLANNCLREGLWEVMTCRKQESGLAIDCHGWFTFPADEYSALFEKLNGESYAKYKDVVEKYPAMGGFALPLESLRTVATESIIPVEAQKDGPRAMLSEQKRKSRLLLTPGLDKQGDFALADKQPIKTARFAEPGWYDVDDPVQFDLRWLATPAKASWRKVKGVHADVALDEIEIAFLDGRRLIVADEALSKLPARSEPPKADGDVSMVTFGISTPEIYLSGADRAKELAAPRNNYLFLLDAEGRHLDNHAAGADRVFLWRDEKNLHVWVVGYERIAIVADFTIPWRAS